MNIFKILLWPIVTSMVLGCATGNYQENTGSSSTPTIIAPASSEENEQNGKTDDFYRQVEQKWRQELINQSQHSTSVYDFNTTEVQKMRSLAKTSEVNQILKQNISLPVLLAIAYERNPRLKEFRQKHKAAQQRYPQSKFLNNIMEQYSSFTRLLDISTGPSLQKKRVAEKTPYPGSLETVGEIITTEVKLAQLQYLIAERDLVYQITRDYWELWFIEQSVTIYREHLDLVKSLEDVAREKFKAALTAYSDVLKAQITREEIATTLEIVLQKMATVKIRLLTALNLPTATIMGTMTVIPEKRPRVTLDQLYSLAKEKRQEILIARLRAQKLQQVIALAEDKLYPDFTSGLSYFENRTGERTGDNVTFPERPQVKPNIWFGQRESYLQEMRLQKEAADKNAENWEQKTIKQVRDLHWQLDTAWRYIVLYRNTLIPLSKEDLRVTRIAYRGTGTKVDFLDVLESERKLLKFQLALYMSRRDYGQRLAELETAIGQRLLK